MACFAITMSFCTLIWSPKSHTAWIALHCIGSILVSQLPISVLHDLCVLYIVAHCFIKTLRDHKESVFSSVFLSVLECWLRDMWRAWIIHLIYLFFLILQRPKFLRPNGKIYQAINADTLRAQNMETWPYFNQVLMHLISLNLGLILQALGSHSVQQNDPNYMYLNFDTYFSMFFWICFSLSKTWIYLSSLPSPQSCHCQWYSLELQSQWATRVESNPVELVYDLRFFCTFFFCLVSWSL